MTERRPEAGASGSLDHRHRSCHLARRRARRELGRAQCRAHQCRREELSRPTSCIPGRRSISTRRSRRRATSARWRRGSGSAPMPPASRWSRRASRATRKSWARMDMVIAAGGGERDIRVDTTILNAQAKGNAAPRLPQRTADERSAPDAVPGAALQPARRQHRDRARRLRHLAHLHGRGSRRRRCGADCAGAHRGRPERHRADRRLAQWRAQGPAAPLRIRRLQSEGQVRAGVGASRSTAGFALGSAGAFLVIESKAHARRARRKAVCAPDPRGLRPQPAPASPARSPLRCGNCGPSSASSATASAIITGATGAEPATSEERAFLGEHPDFAVRSTGTRFGHTLDTQFALGLGLAALSISRGALFPPGDSSGVEIEMSEPPTQIVVVATGHWRGEGMALVEAVS